jgi:hypothetical protein
VNRAGSAIGSRGQVVLLAAAVVAVALVAMLLAFAQLGYHGDVDASRADVPPDADTRRALAHAVENASVRESGRPWSARTETVAAVGRTLDAAVTNLTARPSAPDRVLIVEQNETAAATLAADCPAGQTREFGPCDAAGGVVLQERSGEATVLGVALDVRVSGGAVQSNATYLLRAR